MFLFAQRWYAIENCHTQNRKFTIRKSDQNIKTLLYKKYKVKDQKLLNIKFVCFLIFLCKIVDVKTAGKWCDSADFINKNFASLARRHRALIT